MVYKQLTAVLFSSKKQAKLHFIQSTTAMLSFLCEKAELFHYFLDFMYVLLINWLDRVIFARN